jgi:site-specific recombinase XerC
MELFFTDRRGALARDGVPGIDSTEVHALFERRLVLDGMPVLLDRAMRPVEPLSSWFRHLALAGRSPKTMRKYAYMALRLLDFLGRRGADLASATETDLLEYRALRLRVQDQPVSGATWEVEATAINGLYAWLAEQGHVPARPWRATGGRDSLRGGISRDMMVRHMTLEQYLFLRDVGLAGQTPAAAVERSFRGRLPHRSRAGVQLALLTGMRLGEWSTVLLPELGVEAGGRASGPVEFGLSACAKLRRPRQVYVPQGAIELLVPYQL